MRSTFLLLAVLLPSLAAQEVLPLAEVRAGMRGDALTVFAGSQVDRVPVEILGVLENTGPKRSLILVRLEGEPAERDRCRRRYEREPGLRRRPLDRRARLRLPVRKRTDRSREARRGDGRGNSRLKPSAAGSRTAPIERAAASGWRNSVLTAGLAQIGPPAGQVSSNGMRPILTPVSLAGFTARTASAFATACEVSACSQSRVWVAMHALETSRRRSDRDR